MASRAEFDIYGDLFVAQLAELDVRTHQRVGLLFEYMKDAAVAHAKVNAPWTDRTGNARAGLGGYVERDGNDFGLIIFHRVNYGIYLETKYAGRDAIIIPTLDVFGPRVMSALAGLWDRMRG